jgi:DNA-binding MarR family transcriptional regulator
MCAKDKADVSRAISDMVSKGLVLRQGVNPYRAGIYLTEKGVLAAKDISYKASLATSLAGSEISDEKREIFYEVLSSISSKLKNLSQEGLIKKEVNI